MNFKKKEKTFLKKHALDAHKEFPLKLKKFGTKLGELKDDDLEILSRVTAEIDWLVLSENEITNQGIHHISKINTIRILDLKDVKIDDDCITDLVNLKSLEELNIRYTDISPKGLLSIVAQLPNLKTICHKLDNAPLDIKEQLFSLNPLLEVRLDVS